MEIDVDCLVVELELVKCLEVLNLVVMLVNVWSQVKRSCFGFVAADCRPSGHRLRRRHWCCLLLVSFEVQDFQVVVEDYEEKVQVVELVQE